MKIEHKMFDSEIKSADDSTLTIEHWISTNEKDRGGDRMLPEGMIIKGRPVVLLMHGRGAMGGEPVAKPIDIRVETYKGKKGVVAKTQFYPDAIGQRLYEKVRDGFMPSFSIGYIVIKAEDVYKDGKFDSRLVSKWELLEYSCVSVPMNAGATTFKDGEALCFKLLADDDAEGCCGDCKGDVKCAGHQEKPKPEPEKCPTCKVQLVTFTNADGKDIGNCCEKCDPEKFAELMKAIAPPKPDEETEEPCITCGKMLWKEWTKELPYEAKRVYCKAGCEIICKAPMSDDDMPKRMAAVEKMMEAMDARCKKMEDAMMAMSNAMKSLGESFSKLEPLLKTLSPEPDGEKEGDEEHTENPPEPKRLVFHDSRKEEREREEAENARRRQVVEAVRSHLHAAASEQADRILGKVH